MGKMTRAQFLRGNWRGSPVEPSADALVGISNICLANNGTSCRECDGLCDEDAIRFTPVAGKPAVPVIAEESCTGCGDCLGVCPVDAIDMKERQSDQ